MCNPVVRLVYVRLRDMHCCFVRLRQVTNVVGMGDPVAYCFVWHAV